MRKACSTSIAMFSNSIAWWGNGSPHFKNKSGEI